MTRCERCGGPDGIHLWVCGPKEKQLTLRLCRKCKMEEGKGRLVQLELPLEFREEAKP